MKILFLNPVAQLGGAERMLLDVMASLRAALSPADELVLIAGEIGPLVAEAAKLGVRSGVIEMPDSLRSLGETGATSQIRLAGRAALGTPSLLRYVRQLRRAVREIRPDVIHSNGIKTHLLSRWLRVAPNTKVFWHIHDFIGQRPMMAMLLRRFASQTFAGIAISQAVAQDARAVLPGLPVHTVLNGIDLDRFSPGPSDPQLLDRLSRLPLAPERTLRVGLIATYARWKGQDVFLDAGARVLRDKPESVSPLVRFYIIGGPIYVTRGSQFNRSELEDHANALGIQRDVGFIDFQSDPVPIYRALDVVVHASTKPEPFGRTIAEAMACGKPVVVSAAGGAGEITRSGHDAIAHVPGDVIQLAEGILRLVDRPDLRKCIGNAARESACRQFDRTRMGRQIVQVYLA